MFLLLQIWGGGCYLLNKIGFSLAERAETRSASKRRRISSWVIYLAGLPAWIIVFVHEKNFIAAAVESGGAPAMAAGLITAVRGKGSVPHWLEYMARLAIVFGLALSIREFGGITTVSQLLELGISAGFLMGTYLTARQNAQGYLWLMLGNMACAALMGLQAYYLLMVQQIISFYFVADAYVISLQGKMKSGQEIR